jgi:hypothetical protein
MIAATARAFAIAALAALAAAVCCALVFALQSALTLEMDRDLPRNVSGLYAPEHAGSDTFAWTAKSARVVLPGLDRRVPWTCAVRVRGGRSDPLPQPVVNLQVDGITLSSRPATNALQDLDVTVPPSRVRSGLTLTIAVSNTFVPGPADPRELGVQVDRLQCRPAASTIPLPPPRAISGAMLAAAIFGAAFALIGVTPGSAVGAALLLAAAQATPMTAGFAPYTPYADRAVTLAFWIAVALVMIVAVADAGGRRLRQTARFVVAFSAAALYLKLLGQLHPEKPLIDAVFQAHRLEAVLAGHYFFTQPMPSGVQFPYAIGLYVVAAPWTFIVRDHVALLRIVVCAANAIAGALLYPMIVRVWGDRLAGAAATVLVSVVPISAWVVGNANLTNAFGESIALATVAVVVIWSNRQWSIAYTIAWTALASLAFLSHVSTAATLLATLVALALLYLARGGSQLRPAGRALLIAVLLAGTFSTAIYYGHFGDVYRGAMRVREATAVDRSTGPASGQPVQRDVSAGSVAVRTARALRLAAQSVGWPILILAVVGVWHVRRDQRRDALGLAVIAWSVTFALFLGVALMRMGPQFERYSLEFVGRVVYATCPALVVLAAHGAMAAWRAGSARRAAAAGILLWALIDGAREWAQW